MRRPARRAGTESGRPAPGVPSLTPATKRVPRVLDRADVIRGLAPIDALRRGDGLRPHFALISAPADTDAVDVDAAVAHRPIFRQRRTQDDDVVILAKPGLGSMQRRGMPGDDAARAFDEAQRVPQRFDLLSPFVKVGSDLTRLRAGQRVAALSMRISDAVFDRFKSRPRRPPAFRELPNLAKVSLECRPRVPAFGALDRLPFLREETTADACERVFGEQ